MPQCTILTGMSDPSRLESSNSIFSTVLIADPPIPDSIGHASSMGDKILFRRASMTSLHCVHLARVVQKNEAKLTNVLASRGIRNLGASGGRHMLVFLKHDGNKSVQTTQKYRSKRHWSMNGQWCMFAVISYFLATWKISIMHSRWFCSSTFGSVYQSWWMNAAWLDVIRYI